MKSEVLQHQLCELVSDSSSLKILIMITFHLISTTKENLEESNMIFGVNELK